MLKVLTHGRESDKWIEFLIKFLISLSDVICWLPVAIISKQKMPQPELKKKAYQVLIKKNVQKFYNRSNLSSYFIKKLLSYSDEIFRTNIRH